jgi:PEP-CTERM motif
MEMRNRVLVASSVLAFVLGLTAVAHADTYTFTDSIGAKYALDETNLGGGDWDIFLTIDASGPLSDGVTKLGDVAIKVSSGGTASDPTVTSGYTLTGSEAGGLNNGGCDGSGSGFFCFEGSAPAGSTGDVYTFEFLLTGVSALDTTNGTIKDLFYNSDGVKEEQLSQDGITIGVHSPVPEPSSLMLLGTGALGLAGVVRRRFRR